MRVGRGAQWHVGAPRYESSDMRVGRGGKMVGLGEGKKRRRRGNEEGEGMKKERERRKKMRRRERGEGEDHEQEKRVIGQPSEEHSLFRGE
jgi:hypothetical protein